MSAIFSSSFRILWHFYNSPMASPSIFSPALDLIPHVKNSEGEILTKPFLDVCRLVLPIVDRFGAALSIVKSDIGGNIQRLDTCYQSSPSSFVALYDIVRKDMANNVTRLASSNTNALLWLTRAMDFLTAMLRNLGQHEEWTLYESALAAYNDNLKKYHGWIAQAAFKMALNLAPDRKTFYDKLGAGDVNGDMDRFVSSFWPLLEENHAFLKKIGVDDILAT